MILPGEPAPGADDAGSRDEPHALPYLATAWRIWPVASGAAVGHPRPGTGAQCLLAGAARLGHCSRSGELQLGTLQTRWKPRLMARYRTMVATPGPVPFPRPAAVSQLPWTTPARRPARPGRSGRVRAEDSREGAAEGGEGQRVSMILAHGTCSRSLNQALHDRAGQDRSGRRAETRSPGWPHCPTLPHQEEARRRILASRRLTRDKRGYGPCYASLRRRGRGRGQHTHLTRPRRFCSQGCSRKLPGSGPCGGS